MVSSSSNSVVTVLRMRSAVAHSNSSSSVMTVIRMQSVRRPPVTQLPSSSSSSVVSVLRLRSVRRPLVTHLPTATYPRRRDAPHATRASLTALTPSLSSVPPLLRPLLPPLLTHPPLLLLLMLLHQMRVGRITHPRGPLRMRPLLMLPLLTHPPSQLQLLLLLRQMRLGLITRPREPTLPPQMPRPCQQLFPQAAQHWYLRQTPRASLLHPWCRPQRIRGAARRELRLLLPARRQQQPTRRPAMTRHHAMTRRSAMTRTKTYSSHSPRCAAHSPVLAAYPCSTPQMSQQMSHHMSQQITLMAKWRLLAWMREVQARCSAPRAAPTVARGQ